MPDVHPANLAFWEHWLQIAPVLGGGIFLHGFNGLAGIDWSVAMRRLELRGMWTRENELKLQAVEHAVLILLNEIRARNGGS